MATVPPSIPRPWHVYVLSGDPFDSNTIATPLGRYRSPIATLRIARSFALYGELGGWHTQITHRGLAAALYLEPSTVDDEGRPAGVTYRPTGPACFELLDALAPAFAIIEPEEARQ